MRDCQVLLGCGATYGLAALALVAALASPAVLGVLCVARLTMISPSSNRPSARAQRACESPAAIVQSRRLAANAALASLALLLLSVLVLRPFLFSGALAPLVSLAVLDAL